MRVSICGTFFLVLNFLQLLNLGDGARILCIIPYAGKSHFIVYEKLLTALAKRGHEVDVYGHWPVKNPVKGYNDYSLVGSIETLTGKQTMKEIYEWRKLMTILHVMAVQCGTEICEPIFNSKPILELKNTTKKYDVLITEIFGTDCMLGFAHYFGIPSIIVGSAAYYDWGSDFMGLPDNPAYIPAYYSAHSSKMTFYERLMNTVLLMNSKIYYRLFSLEPSTVIARKFFGPNLPHLDVLLKNVSLEILNSHFSINQARPLPPNVIEVGGIHIEEPKPLDKKFLNLVETLEPNTKGVIYFTLGSLVQTETLPHEMLQGMFRALEKLPYRVLWKANRENIPKNITLPKNIYFEFWMPQLDILCHPNVKLYISHGGNAGVQESVYCGVPMLGIPLFADQEMNVAHLIYLGMAEKLELEEIDEEMLFERVYKMLNDPKYANSAKKAQTNFKDRPISPSDVATYWIEYVINHKGAPELRSTATDLYWFQYCLLDVILVLVGGTCLGLYLVYLGVMFTLGKLWKVEKVKNVKQKTQ